MIANYMSCYQTINGRYHAQSIRKDKLFKCKKRSNDNGSPLHLTMQSNRHMKINAFLIPLLLTMGIGFLTFLK